MIRVVEIQGHAPGSDKSQVRSEARRRSVAHSIDTLGVSSFILEMVLTPTSGFVPPKLKDKKRKASVLKSNDDSAEEEEDSLSEEVNETAEKVHWG